MKTKLEINFTVLFSNFFLIFFIFITCIIIFTGYTTHQTISGKCYKFHSEPLSWHDAYLACKLEEGHLAIINSAKEASIVAGFLGEHLNSNIPDPNILYLGFSDLMFPYQYRTITGNNVYLIYIRTGSVFLFVKLKLTERFEISLANQAMSYKLGNANVDNLNISFQVR